MAHLIDKDALVAKIERRVELNITCQKISGGNEFYRGAIDEAKEILSSLDTLEVKEVPIWEKVSPDTGQTTLYKDGGKSYLERFGYRIDLKDLDMLPKKELKAQKGELL